MTQTEKPKEGVSIYSEICAGCQYCQLACSFNKTGKFNPAESNIQLHRVDGQDKYRISFTNNCDQCGYCARYCFYGVLGKDK